MVREQHHWTGLEVAVIGMACRFPGAGNTAEFWENLKNGVESITFFSEEELLDKGISPERLKSPNLVKARGIVENIEFFDASFFGYRPLEAETMDPQIRIFYECAWDVLETAGYNPENYNGLIGLYAGASNNRYWEMLAFMSGRNELMGTFVMDHLVDRDFVSTRLAYRLNLRGPAITLKTACSTTLAAVNLGCRGLLTGECDMALAGGVSIVLSKVPGYVYSEGMVNSPDGHCRTFDIKAGGVIFSDGVGVVVLKRLQEAIADRDTIYAVIKSSVANNDGSRKGAYEAPCVEGQAEVIRSAVHLAEVPPETITYIETHGTGTVIGDPIEFEGLKKAFNTKKKGFCALGSVKTNFGHTDTAAGIAGFIKTVLALKHRLIPPSLHYEISNSKIDFENSPFYVNTEPVEWKNGKYPLRAGVSSFGVGGTNVHVILEEAPEPEETSPGKDYQMILLSARSENALNQAAENLMKHLKENPGVNLADTAYTLQLGRKAFKWRNAWVVDRKSPVFDRLNTGTARDKNRVVFMFPGQGAQYVNMGRQLYQKEPLFKQELDRCFEILNTLVDYHIEEILYPERRGGSPCPPNVEVSYSGSGDHRGSPLQSDHINQTEITQPVLFIFEYALAKLLMHWGIKPYAMMGHSIGEYAAACLSGVFSLADALKVVVARGKFMQQMPTGAMLGITLPEEKLVPMLSGNNKLALAAVNAPSLCVVSGPHHDIDTLENQLKTGGHDYRRLHTSHAFHSSMMDPILEKFEIVVKQITLKQPRLPYISNVTGKWITVEQAVDPAYWANHLRQTIRFADGLTLLLNEPDTIFIEVGPGRSLSTFVKKHPGKKTGQKNVNLVKHPKEEQPDQHYLLNNIAQLWLNGQEIDWAAFYRDEKRQRVPLPTYPFERKRYWLEGNLDQLDLGKEVKRPGLSKRSDIARWFYIPSWKQVPPPGISPPKSSETRNQPGQLNWLLLMDEDTFGTRLLERLQHPGGTGNDRAAFTVVQIGEKFSATGNEGYTINPRQADHYRALMAELKKQGKIPNRVIHLWNLTTGKPGPGLQWNEAIEDRGFYSLIYLAQAIGREDITGDIYITVVTNNMQEVTGEEDLHPQKAVVLGPVMIIPREYSNLKCRSLDVVRPEPGSKKERKLIDQLVSEFGADAFDHMNAVAYRNNYRWVQTFEPMPRGDSQQKPPPLKEGGVYLITGGLGGIGLVLAQHLVKTVKAKLILTGRSNLPAREEWDAWLKSHPTPDKTSGKIRKIRELERTGVELMVFSADITDEDRMRTVVADVEERWGTINGVIHAAGMPGGGIIQVKTREKANRVMSAKIKGTLVLDTILKEHPLDFFMLCSSINSVIPILGQVDYCAANAFLDAYAHYKTSHDGIFTISVNWDAWKEVGMAVEAAKQLTGVKEYHDLKHPLYEKYIEEEPGREIYISHFSLDSHWVLNEHKIAESGKGLVPGATYLEMAREAFEKHHQKENNPGPNHAIEISDVYFLNPLIVGEGERREVRLILEKQNEPDSYDFQVRSRENPDRDNWQKHAVGKIRRVEVDKEPLKHDIDKFKAACDKDEVIISRDRESNKPQDHPGGLLIFGPRWKSFEWLRFGINQGLVCLELAEEFREDLDFYRLHPSLLDMATAFLFNYVNRGSAYIPFGYTRLTMKGPLPAKIYSYSRLVEGGEAGEEFLEFDVTITDEQGVELVDIKKFSMLQVSEQVKGKIKEKETPSSHHMVSPDVDSHWAEAEEKETINEKGVLKNGILSREGVEVFNRVLWETQPQVVVSTMDLPARIEDNKVSAPVFSQEEFEVSRPTGPVLPRPELSTVYVAPEDESQQIVANIWQEILGIDKIGIHDDFFQLGGDSLSIVQVNNKLKKTLKKDIPVAVMFRHLTVQSFVEYLQGQEKGENETREKVDRSEEVKKGRRRLKTRIRRR
jgi:acyl transferase domain-containing protein/acyl carrier protein